MTHVNKPKLDARCRIVFAPADLLDTVSTLQQMLKDSQEDVERLATEVEYLKERDVLHQKRVYRMAANERAHFDLLKSVAGEVQAFDDRVHGQYAPRDLVYKLVSVVCALALDAEDRPLHLDEMLQVAEGFDRWDAEYVH